MHENKKSGTSNEIKKRIIKMADRYDEDGDVIEISLSKFLSTDISTMKIRSIAVDIKLMITGESGNYFVGWDFKSGIKRCKSISHEGWNHKYSVGTYGAKMVEVIKKMEKTNENIKFENTEDDGEYFDVWYKIKFDEDVMIKDAFVYITNFEKELVGHTDAMLYKENISSDVLKDEKDFSLNVLLPLFRNMGYINPQYNHGPREFGRDIVFSEIDKMGIRRNFGVQVKAGNLSGEASSELDNLIGQIDDAFEMFYLDIYTREKRRITDLIIAVSGKFTGNAPQKILEKIQDRNVHFFDIDKIRELLTKYMKKKID